MRRLLIWGWLCAIASFGPSPAFAKLTLEPSTQWSLRAYDDKCRVRRDFGEGKNAVTLWIDQVRPGEYANLTLIGHPFRTPYGPQATLAFAPGEPLTRGYISSTSSKGHPVIAMFGVAPIAFAGLSDDAAQEETVDLMADGDPTIAPPDVLAKRYDTVQSLDISGALLDPVSLKVGGLNAIVERLEACMESLAQRRAVLPSGEARTGRAPRPDNPARWAAKIQADYPTYLLSQSAEGEVGVTVQVNPQGRASFCQVRMFDGPPGFNDAACLGMIRHARFLPATDEAGKPRWGSFSTIIRYSLN